MFINAPNATAITILNIPIYWYGITMALAILFGVLLSNKLFNEEKKDFFINYAPLFVITSLLGARLYFCFLKFPYYLQNPIEILNFRQGGLSIHGAIFVGIITFTLIAKSKKLSLLKLLDSAVCGTILGQAIGRWGNFFNSEAFGLPTSQTWGLYIPQPFRPYEFISFNYFHPTFLYECVLDIIGLILLLHFYNKNKEYKGFTFFLYLVIYSIIRFFIEGIRIDSALTIGIPFAQIISIIMFICGIFGLFYLKKKYQ